MPKPLTREQWAERRARHAATGLCQRCTRPRAPRGVFCDVCLIGKHEYAAQHRKRGLGWRRDLASDWQSDPASPEVVAGVLLIGLVRGILDAGALAAWSGATLAFAQECLARLEEQGVWDAATRTLCVDWLEEDSPPAQRSVAHLLDAMVALGMVTRDGPRDPAQGYMYAAVTPR